MNDSTHRTGTRLRDRSRDLAPNCFAPVMATGIVSRALDMAGAHRASDTLLLIAVGSYALLLTGILLKAVRHRDRLAEDLRRPARLFGAFTFTAASDVLATGLSTTALRPLATALLVVAAPAWAVVATAAVRALRAHGRAALHQADGSWLLATVGLQSLVLALTATHQGPRAAVVAVSLWACGGLLYVATLAVLGHRLLRSPPGPQDLDPTYWITMGAAAITLLAGCQLPAHVRSADLDSALLGTWVWATLLIPALLAAGVWRHLRRRVPLVYAPALWCIVFPTGMYAAATQRLGTATAPPPLPLPSGVLVLCAVTAWLAVSALLVTGYRVRLPAP